MAREREVGEAWRWRGDRDTPLNSPVRPCRFVAITLTLEYARIRDG
jgi:hypothetical protein